MMGNSLAILHMYIYTYSYLSQKMPFITFSMYEYKMKCRLKDEKMSEKNLLFSLKSNLCMQNTVLKMTGCIRNDIYHEIGDYL